LLTLTAVMLVAGTSNFPNARNSPPVVKYADTRGEIRMLVNTSGTYTGGSGGFGMASYVTTYLRLVASFSSCTMAVLTICLPSGVAGMTGSNRHPAAMHCSTVGLIHVLPSGVVTGFGQRVQGIKSAASAPATVSSSMAMILCITVSLSIACCLRCAGKIASSRRSC